MEVQKSFIKNCEKYLFEQLSIGIRISDDKKFLFSSIITLDDINLYKGKIDLIYQTSNLCINLDDINYRDTKDEYYTKIDNIIIDIWFL